MISAFPSSPSICQGHQSQLTAIAETPILSYCIPQISDLYLHYLGEFDLTDTTGNTTYVTTFNNSAPYTPNNYVDHGTAATTGSLAAGGTYSISGSYGGAYEGLAVWIDLNQNGVFDNSELLYAAYGGGASGGQSFNANITIHLPPSAV
jgi:hypothetical protein